MRPITTKIIAAALILAVLAPAAGCRDASPIGDIVYDVFETPVMALMFEPGEDAGDTGYGVVYREVTDIDRLIASEDIPVLVVFMDGRTLSDQAIAFTEDLCDRFQTTARIVRVNVKLGDNTEDIDSLVSLFKVSDYPWFAVCYKGQMKSAISGYSTELQTEITAMLQDAAE
jgi:hypothetical protein